MLLIINYYIMLAFIMALVGPILFKTNKDKNAKA